MEKLAYWFPADKRTDLSPGADLSSKAGGRGVSWAAFLLIENENRKQEKESQERGTLK